MALGDEDYIQVVGGTCFKLDWCDEDDHYWFVLSNPVMFPGDDIVCVNITTYDATASPMDVYNDPSCILEAGSHPLINRTTCVCYEGFPDGRCSLDFLEDRINSDLPNRYTIPGPPADANLLARMREGVKRTQHMPFGNRAIMQNQGLA